MSYLLIAAFVVLAAVAALLAAAETAVLMLPPGRVHRLAEAEKPGAGALERLGELRHRLRAVTTLAGGLAFGAAALVGWTVAIDAASPLLGMAGTYAVAALSALLGVVIAHAAIQALPRTLAVTNPERLALDTARFALPLTRALYPLARLLGAPWKWAVSLADTERSVSPWAVTPEWRGAESDDESEREEAEEALLEAVSDFAEKVVREVMVPRTDMAALPDTATIDEAIALIRSTGFTRLPVYRRTVDDVRGVVYAKDLLGVVATEGTGGPVIDHAREPYFVPETKPVEELLFEMRAKTHIAIVADEYGGTAGLVTLEDLLEEIVGEISDEYDREEALLVELGDGRYRVDARLPVDDLNATFGTDIEADADSVGGLFTEVAGHIPEVGESLTLEGLRLTVDRLEGTRIRQLCVEPAATDA